LIRTREVVSARKMSSKIQNRIYSKPLKINLKTSRRTVDEEPGLQPLTGTISVAEPKAKLLTSYSQSRAKVDWQQR
jgi:hypothetical protein